MERPNAADVDANVALIRDSLTLFNAGDLDGCVAVLAPDLVMNLAEAPAPLRGRATWRAGAELMRRAFPDLTAHLHDVFGAGDRVAVRLHFTGTHTGEFLGIAATGRTVEYVSHEFYRVHDGLIAEEWICSDTASLMRRIGPPP